MLSCLHSPPHHNLYEGIVHHGQEDGALATAESGCTSDVVQKHAGIW